jgi:hypothetical protein
VVKLSDVNTRDIRDAVALGCHTMSSIFDPGDRDVPYFGARARPVAMLGGTSESHVPGRHLNALLNAEDAAGMALEEDAVDKHARACFFSYGASLPLPLQRVDPAGQPSKLLAHDIREGFHALYSLVKYRHSERARELAEASIATIFDLWDPDSGWDVARMRRDHGVELWDHPLKSLVYNLGRSVGPLVKYYRATGYGPALELAAVLKEKLIGEIYLEDGSHDNDLFGTHSHSTTCVMSSLAQLADLTRDSTLMDRVRAFYDNGLWAIRDEIGWSIEGSGPPDKDYPQGRNPDRGESNNTGDIVETALILGRWGYTQYYHDAERILRGHLLPAQLRDVSWMEEPANPDGADGRRDVVERMRGAFGTPAPYGHEPIGLPSVGFAMDIVGGSVGSLCEAYREATRLDEAGQWVNLLFDHETPDVQVESPYTHSALRVRVKRPGPLFVRVPPWVDRGKVRVEGVAGRPRFSNGYFFIAEPPVNRTISFDFPLAGEEITMKHRTRDIRVRFRGDEVVAMDNHGADLTYFDHLE